MYICICIYIYIHQYQWFCFDIPIVFISILGTVDKYLVGLCLIYSSHDICSNIPFIALMSQPMGILYSYESNPQLRPQSNRGASHLQECPTFGRATNGGSLHRPCWLTQDLWGFRPQVFAILPERVTKLKE